MKTTFAIESLADESVIGHTAADFECNIRQLNQLKEFVRQQFVKLTGNANIKIVQESASRTIKPIPFCEIKKIKFTKGVLL